MAGNKRAKKAAAAAAHAKEVDQQMQQVLSLMSARTRGEATNEQVEKAVSKILSTAGLGPPQATGSSKASKKPPAKPINVQAEIQVDTEDYDFDEDEEEKAGSDDKNRPSTHTDASTNTSAVLPASGRKRKREEKEAQEEVKRRYKEIPLGQQGAHMMTSFGDGPCPDPQVVSAALLGARALLQCTVQDARALKRQNMQQFEKARMEVAKNSGRRKRRGVDPSVESTTATNESSLSSSNKKKEKPETLVGPDVLYRAFLGYDKLARNARCGFNFEQLESLFPEEMRCYSRWNSLRDEYQKNSNEKEQAAAVATDQPAEEKEEPSAAQEENPNDGDEEDGGHLRDRAVQFDLRTNRMDRGWYMRFSEHRKGSFLPRRIRQEGDSEWEENRRLVKEKESANGKIKETGVWAKMSAKSARFLHWVGFDPDKGLPPPNDETTQALAFLGYDFMGRIVEKAIFLKNLAKAKASNEDVDERSILLELEDGEQLNKADIELAMRDIRPAAMYSGNIRLDSAHKPVAQLYFGPGFEERVEMELDELMCASDDAQREDLSAEEAKIRKQEDELFAKMAEPPTKSDVTHLLAMEDNDKEETGEQTSPNKEETAMETPPKSKPNTSLINEIKEKANKESGKDTKSTESPPQKRARGRTPIKRRELKKWGEELAG